jgi:hypothetical protein
VSAKLLRLLKVVTQVATPLPLFVTSLFFPLQSKSYKINPKMKSFSAVLVVALASHADAFGSSFAGSKLSYSVVNSGTTSMEYIPK